MFILGRTCLMFASTSKPGVYLVKLFWCEFIHFFVSPIFPWQCNTYSLSLLNGQAYRKEWVNLCQKFVRDWPQESISYFLRKFTLTFYRLEQFIKITCICCLSTKDLAYKKEDVNLSQRVLWDRPQEPIQ